ncbi:MAG: MBL fold metallo-hydrolase [Saprospiraceae bacterium]
MKITLLGTGTSQGVPVIGCDCEACQSTDLRDKRLRTSAMIEVNGKTIVIDIGPDFRQQMIRAKVQKVDAILLTHEHSDHVIGLDDVRPFNFRYLMDMPVYGEQRVLDSLRERFAYIFASNPYPGVPRVTLNPISKNEPLELFGQSIVPIEVLHYKLPVLGFRFDKFTYITDIKTISEEEIEKVKGTEYLVVSALRREEHISHFTLEEALDFIKKIKPKQAYLTHLSHRMGKHEDLENELPENVSVAYDGLSFTMND